MLAPVRRGKAMSGSSLAYLHDWMASLARMLGWTGAPYVGLALAAMIVVGCLVRAGGLPDAPGTLARDESRLALAAQGILVTGLPTSPGGVLYTRGLLPAYVEAGVFALLGVSDHAARLPALIVGTLVIPATYWLARGFSREWPAVTAAAIVALSLPLIELSREAWLYPWLTLWILLAAGWLVRADRQSSTSAYLLASLSYAAAVFSHELAAVFLPAVALTHILRFRSGLTWGAVRPFWLVAVPATLTALALTVMLRSPTAAGGGSEFETYLRRTVDVSGVLGLLRLIADSHAWLIPVAALGFVVSAARARWRSPVWLPILTVLVLLVFNGLVLTRRGHPRDIQVLIPLLAALAAYAAWQAGPFVASMILGWRPTARRFRWLGFLFGLALTAGSVSGAGLSAVARKPGPEPTWRQAMTRYSPDDLVLSFAPTETTHYLGRTDFWLRPNGYSRYVWSGSPPYRDIYTGAVVIRNARELETLVIAPNSGRKLWVLGQRELPPEQRSGLTEMLNRLLPITVEEPATGDQTRVLRVQL
jgi:4-amino-4-deoxy-L-arabinose transferase-like glycosyltransferase